MNKKVTVTIEIEDTLREKYLSKHMQGKSKEEVQQLLWNEKQITEDHIKEELFAEKVTITNIEVEDFE